MPTIVDSSMAIGSEIPEHSVFTSIFLIKQLHGYGNYIGNENIYFESSIWFTSKLIKMALNLKKSKFNLG